MIPYIELLFAVIAGTLVKYVDDLEDKKKGKSSLKWPLAVLYGILIGYLISYASFSMLFLGALIAQLLAVKIDRKSHAVGFLAAAVSALFFGMPLIEVLPFTVFLITGYLDELVYPVQWSFVSDYRLLLKLAALCFVFIGRFDYLIGIILFDGGYLVIDRFHL